jgi:hypothetical protein
MPSLQTYYSTRLTQEHYTINNSRLFFYYPTAVWLFSKKNIIHRLLNQLKTCVGATKGSSFLPNIVQQNDLL